MTSGGQRNGQQPWHLVGPLRRDEDGDKEQGVRGLRKQGPSDTGHQQRQYDRAERDGSTADRRDGPFSGAHVGETQIRGSRLNVSSNSIRGEPGNDSPGCHLMRCVLGRHSTDRHAFTIS